VPKLLSYYYIELMFLWWVLLLPFLWHTILYLCFQMTSSQGFVTWSHSRSTLDLFFWTQCLDLFFWWLIEILYTFIKKKLKKNQNKIFLKEKLGPHTLGIVGKPIWWVGFLEYNFLNFRPMVLRYIYIYIYI
jgi:hypothetical protein